MWCSSKYRCNLLTGHVALQHELHSLKPRRVRCRCGRALDLFTTAVPSELSVSCTVWYSLSWHFAGSLIPWHCVSAIQVGTTMQHPKVIHAL
jgi:hypothetical protein